MLIRLVEPNIKITKTENAIFLSNTVIQLFPFVFKCQQALIRLQKGSQGSSQTAPRSLGR